MGTKLHRAGENKTGNGRGGERDQTTKDGKNEDDFGAPGRIRRPRIDRIGNRKNCTINISRGKRTATDIAGAGTGDYCQRRGPGHSRGDEILGGDGANSKTDSRTDWKELGRSTSNTSGGDEKDSVSTATESREDGPNSNKEGDAGETEKTIVERGKNAEAN